MLQVLYFTATAIILYFLSDWLLQKAESIAGRRFEHRSIIFFVILVTLAVGSFSAIEHYLT